MLHPEDIVLLHDDVEVARQVREEGDDHDADLVDLTRERAADTWDFLGEGEHDIGHSTCIRCEFFEVID